MAQRGSLFIVPTPIGNLGDVTERTHDALAKCDVVFAEDTRVTGKLLSALGIRKPVERLDESVLAARMDAVLSRIDNGEAVAYCTDAGMPGVSDPGLRLVSEARKRELPITVLPGASAVQTAYVASGTRFEKYYFGGFLSKKEGQRNAELSALQGLDASLIFFESPRRVARTLADIAKSFPNREVAVCRELTKLHEEVVRGNAQEVAGIFAAREKEGKIKGEIAIVIDGPSQQEREQEAEKAFESAADTASKLLDEGKLAKREIVSFLQDEFGISRNDAYAIVHG